MTRKEAMRRNAQEFALISLGFSVEESESLRRISNTLRRWYEHECNGAIQRDETTDKPAWYNTNTARRICAAPDRERGAIRRLDAIMSAHAPLSYHLQTDPRGATLYILRPGDVPAGQHAESYYSRGICVY